MRSGRARRRGSRLPTMPRTVTYSPRSSPSTGRSRRRARCARCCRPKLFAVERRVVSLSLGWAAAQVELQAIFIDILVQEGVTTAD